MLQRPLLLALLLVGAAASSCSSFTEFLYQGRLEYGPRESNGQQTGLWKYWFDPAHDHLRATGRFERDRPVGRWEFFHENGTKRWEVGFRDEAFDGASTAWWPSGRTRSRGAFELGLEQGPWTFWDETGAKSSEGSFVRGVRDGTWRYFAPDGAVKQEIAFVRGAVRSTTAAVATEPRAGASQPERTTPPQVAVEPPPTPPLGVVAPPITTLARDVAREEVPDARQGGYSIEQLTEIYDSGKAQADSGGGGYPKGDPRNPPSQPKRDDAKSDPFVGKVLPFTKVVQGDGTSLDLGAFRGKSKVLVVVLRGMKGRICEYCTAQTQALQRRVEDFRRLNCEIVIVYPGPTERLEEFLTAARDYYLVHYGSPQAPSTCRLTCDDGFQLVENLGLRKDLAIPAAFLLDTESKVRFAWVSKDRQDRPSCERLLEELRKL